MFEQMNGKTETATVPPSRLLLVDDDPALLLALSGTLKSRLGPCAVDACGSGTQALKLMETHTYDTILSDVMMPGMDGWQFLRAVKDSQCDTPVFMMSGIVDQAVIIQALKAGASSLFTKPFDRDEIVTTLGEGIRLSRLKGVLAQEDTQIRRSTCHHAMLVEKLHQHDTSTKVPTQFIELVDQVQQRRTAYRATITRHMAILDDFILKLTEIHRRTSSRLSVVQENIRRHALSRLQGR